MCVECKRLTTILLFLLLLLLFMQCLNPNSGDTGEQQQGILVGSRWQEPRNGRLLA